MEETKIILVTGANRGIGLEICRQLASAGHRVILTARDEEKGRSAAASISGQVQFFRVDMADPASFKDVQNYIAGQFGYLDVLINNAGIMSSSLGFDQAVPDEIHRVMETNLFGVIGLTQALLALLQKSSAGRIINISSGMGALNDMAGGYAGYRLSKTALNSFTAVLAADLSATKIRVNSMCPGWVKTDMGGSGAHRPVEKGAETAVWLATAGQIPNGKFLRDKTVIDW